MTWHKLLERLVIAIYCLPSLQICHDIAAIVIELRDASGDQGVSGWSKATCDLPGEMWRNRDTEKNWGGGSQDNARMCLYNKEGILG